MQYPSSSEVQFLDDDVLHEFVVECQKDIDRLAATQAQLVEEWNTRKVWANNGSRSPASRLERETGMSSGDCKHIVTRARRLKSMPLTMKKFEQGELSSSRVDLLVRANQPKLSELFARDEEALIDIIDSLSFGDAQRAVNYWIANADESSAKSKAEKQLEQRTAQCSKTFEGTRDLRALFDPIGGEIFCNELERIEKQFFEEDWAEVKAIYGDNVSVDDLKRTAAQRRCDALVEMAKRSASSTGSNARPLISIVCGLESFKNVLETAEGTVLHSSQVIPLLSDAQIERIVFDSRSRILDVSHKRLFEGALRHAIQIRDRHCQHSSGCDVPAHLCHIDHIVAASRGGATYDYNGQAMCAPHNRWKGAGPP